MAELGFSRQLAACGQIIVRASRCQTSFQVPAQALRRQRQLTVCRSGGSLNTGSPFSQTRVEALEGAQPSDAPVLSFERRQAAPSPHQTPAAVFVGLRLAQAFRIIAHAATYLVIDMRHGLFRKARQTQQSLTQAQQTIQQAVVQPVQTISHAESELKAAWARLQQHAVAGGDALMKMLHSLDKPSITLDKKWADMQEQLAGNKDVSDRLQTLFASSVESTQTVATMLAQTGGKLQHSYWTSPQTKKVIDQEEELRSVVFAQMLGATS